MLDPFNQWSNGLHLRWFLMLAADLPAKSHVLKIRVSEEKNVGSKGNALRIVNFLVNE